jgi:hypothetical protein
MGRAPKKPSATKAKKKIDRNKSQRRIKKPSPSTSLKGSSWYGTAAAALAVARGSPLRSHHRSET